MTIQTLEPINVLTAALTRLDVHRGGEPVAVATAPVRAAGSLSLANIGGTGFVFAVTATSTDIA